MKKAISVFLVLLMLAGVFSFASSAAIIGENPDGTTIDLVKEGDGVEFNRGTIIENRGSVGTNYGVIEKNYGTVAFHRADSVIENHGGTIRNLFNGTVKNFGGSVNTVFGGKVLLFGGSVDDNYGGTVIEYKKVTLDIIGAAATGLTEENGGLWIEKNGEFVIAADEDFIFEVAPTVSGGDIIDNGDGTYTVKNITGDITLEARAAAKPTTEPTAEKTQSELFMEMLFLLVKLLAHLLMSL